MNTKEKIEVMQAYLDGKKIELKGEKCVDGWSVWSSGELNWNWEDNEYRIKKELVERWGTTDKRGKFYTTFEYEIEARDWASLETGRRYFKMREVIE